MKTKELIEEMKVVKLFPKEMQVLPNVNDNLLGKWKVDITYINRNKLNLLVEVKK